MSIKRKRDYACFIRKATSYSIVAMVIGLICFSPVSLTWGDTLKTSRLHVIRVGVFNYYPLVFEKNGVPTGFHFELLKEIAREEGWILDLQFVDSFKNASDGLEFMTLDLGMGLAPTSERSQFLDFTKEKNALLKGQVFVRSDRQDIQDINDLTEITVGYIREDAIGENFIAVCQKLGVTPNIVLTNSFDDLYNAIVTGDIAAGIFSNLMGKKYSKTDNHIKATQIVFKPMEIQYAVHKGSDNTFITEALDAHLLRLKKIEGSIYYKIKNRFISEPLQRKKEMSKQDIQIALLICFLLVLFGTMVGLNMIEKKQTGKILQQK